MTGLGRLLLRNGQTTPTGQSEPAGDPGWRAALSPHARKPSRALARLPRSA